MTGKTKGAVASGPGKLLNYPGKDYGELLGPTRGKFPSWTVDHLVLYLELIESLSVQAREGLGRDRGILRVGQAGRLRLRFFGNHVLVLPEGTTYDPMTLELGAALRLVLGHRLVIVHPGGGRS